MQSLSRPLPFSARDTGRQNASHQNTGRQNTDHLTVVAIRPSLLRVGLVARLAGAACLVAGIWSVIAWVLE